MMSAPLFLAFLTCATMLWTPCSPHYKYDAHRRQHGLLRWLSHELVMDAEMKIKAVQHYRDQYYKSLQYQLGDMMYEMRDFFKKMVLIYQGTDKNVSYSYFNHNQNILDFIRIHRMSMDIEAKVVMVQTWQMKRENKEQHYERMQAVLRSGTNQEYDELENLPLRGAGAPAPGARGRRRAATPRAAAFDLGDKRNNKKWRHFRDDVFARRSL